ncbi:MAG: lipopolysaccharide export LptBFGC system permease protein LptF [Motiliproteus sp.]|jgi:lipopolysaccharide export LptBFGC system permease protein LptF
MWLMWLKKYFKLAMFLFLVASVAVVLTLKGLAPGLSDEQRADVNQLLDAEPRIRSYVWNPEDRLYIGVIREQLDPKGYAQGLCQKMEALNAFGVSIAVVDVIKLQQSGGGDWDEIAYVQCPRKE